MKNLTIVIIALLISPFIQAQYLSTGFSFGTGSSYVVEHIQSEGFTTFYPSFCSSIDLKYHKEEAYFNIGLKFLHVNTRFESSPWWGGKLNKSNVTTVSTFIMLEHLKTDKKWNAGYNFGYGFTSEKFGGIVSDGSARYSHYMSVSTSAIINYQINDQMALRCTPTIFWTDPGNSFNSDNWVTGGEDLSILVLLGFEYSLK